VYAPHALGRGPTSWWLRQDAKQQLYNKSRTRCNSALAAFEVAKRYTQAVHADIQGITHNSHRFYEAKVSHRVHIYARCALHVRHQCWVKQ
jgi:catalase (peroxidase I)